jgi:hypothetical protein
VLSIQFCCFVSSSPAIDCFFFCSGPAAVQALLLGSLAGAEGFEPPKTVLETAGLPLSLRPFFR